MYYISTVYLAGKMHAFHKKNGLLVLTNRFVFEQKDDKKKLYQ